MGCHGNYGISHYQKGFIIEEHNIIITIIIVIIIIIIIISIFKEDIVFSITASLPYGPPVNTDIDYYWTFFRTC